MSRKHKKNRLEKQRLQHEEQADTTAQTQDAPMVRASYYVIISILVLIAYGNAMNAAFVSDDLYGINNNPLIRDWSHVMIQKMAIVQPLLYYFVSNVFGYEPFWFRLINILAHIGSANLLFIILSMVSTPLVAFFSAALFAVHPMMIESVTWISGGPYSRYTFFSLLSLYFYIRMYDSSKKYYWYAASVFTFWLVLATNIAGVVLSGVYLLFDICYKNWKKTWYYSFPYVILALIYGVIALSGIGAREESFVRDYYQTNLKYNSYLQLPVAVTTYLQLFIWPDALTLYHSELNYSYTEFGIRVGLLFVFIGLWIYSFFKSKPVFFGISIFVLGLIPTLTPHGIHWVIAERYAYFSMIGLVFVTAYLLCKIPKAFEGIMYTILIGLIIGFTVRTIIRNVDWQNEDNLWIATGKTSPSDPKTHNNLGDVYVRRGDYKRAAESLITAIKINPIYADAYHNLGNVYQRAGQIDPAMQMYQQALKINPRLWQTYQNIAALHFAKNELASAEAFMKQAVKLNPNSSQIHGYIGIIALNQKKYPEARAAFEYALKLNPNEKIAITGLEQMKNLR